jgi:hypothetical protein
MPVPRSVCPGNPTKGEIVSDFESQSEEKED